MAYRNTYYKIIDKIKNSFTQNGYRQVTFGTEKDIDLFLRQNSYPFCHIIVPSVSSNFDVISLSFTIIVGDKIDTIPNNSLSKDNSIDIWQHLLNISQSSIESLTDRYLTNYDAIEIGFNVGGDIRYAPFKEDYPEISTGYLISFTVEYPNVSNCK